MENKNIENNNNKKIEPLIVTSHSSSFSEIRRENYGLGIAIIATFFMSMNVFYAKYIQKAYPNDFQTVPFLFIRSFCIVICGLIHTKISGIPLLKPSEITQKIWFFYRTNINFFLNFFQTSSLLYIRASTTQIINSTSPVFTLFLSYFILKEKLYPRFFVGSIICIIGSLIIVLNERSNNNTKKSSTGNIIKGVGLASLAAVCMALISISNKVLAANKIPINTQVVYLGGCTMMYSFIYIIIFGGISLTPGYILMCTMHGIFFFMYNATYNQALIYAPVSKVVIVTYLQIVFVFILAAIFLGEHIYITDIIGASLMISYMLYNYFYPINK